MTGSISHPVHIPNVENAKVAAGGEKGIHVGTLSMCIYVYFPKGYN